MINIDSRLLDELEADELFLLTHLTKRINGNSFCWPSNATLMAETKMSYKKLQRVKRGLEKKEVVRIEQRSREDRKGQTSNAYYIVTPLVKNYTPLPNLPGGDRSNQPGGGSPELPMGDRSNMPGAPSPKVPNEVLENEVLTNEELKREELIREKNWVSLRYRNLFEILIESIFPSLEKYKEHDTFKDHELDGENFILSNEIRETIDPTIKKTLEKIMGAAVKIFDAFEELQRPRAAYRKYGDREGKPRDPDAWKESKEQIEAYADWCRLTGTYLTTDPDKLPEKIITTDWCEKLLQYADERINAKPPKNYDPAYDEDLISYWLIEVFYWTPRDAFVCKRYNNRIVHDGQEYLKTKENAENYRKVQN